VPELGQDVAHVGYREHHGALDDGCLRQGPHLLEQERGENGRDNAAHDGLETERGERERDVNAARCGEAGILPAVLHHGVEKDNGDGVVGDTLAKDE